ncbi:hypothetical protein [Clostridium sp.]|uniref:hypothetical protein n=1 Tax=Clostridium sp. TaxID=1506 RepID=UPI002FDEE3DE
MNMNFKGLVNLHTLPVTLPLLPLYEAVLNSIQSIEDIIIKDNGIGFTDDNYNSFNTYASEHKLEKGCKGVGRMLWLKAFCDVEVESIYDEKGKRKQRKFLFDTNNEVYNLSIKEVEDESIRETKVRLNTLRHEYKSNCPKRLDTIARNILNHCFTYYVLGKAPKILVSDDRDTIDVDKIYRENISGNIDIVTANANGIDLKIIHSKNYMVSGDRHEINLCAHNRAVQQIYLTKLFTNLNTRLQDEKGEFIYSGYVLSTALDSHVNRERTKFNLPEQKNMVEKVGSAEIFNVVKKKVSEFLEEDINGSNRKKEAFIKDYVFNKNPKYRLLLKNCSDLLSDIPWTTDEDKLEMELFKQEQKYKLELKKEGKRLEEEAKKDIVDYQKYMEKRTAYAEKLSDVGKGNLAEYVMHRKAVLDILASNLKFKDFEQKRYAYEKNIHQLIFPMTKTSDDIDYLQHNLWIIDEKLAYHHHLASQIQN